MLVYCGMEGDKADERGAKLKALQGYFKESDPHALNMLGAADLSKSNTARGTRLVLNSHGNVTTFADLAPDAFLHALQAKGFAAGSFDEVWLMACQVGNQNQTNTISNNFARDFKHLLATNGIGSKVYAPRGTLTYQFHVESKSGQNFYVVDAMTIACPERNYSLSEGVLLVA